MFVCFTPADKGSSLGGLEGSCDVCSLERSWKKRSCSFRGSEFTFEGTGRRLFSCVLRSMCEIGSLWSCQSGSSVLLGWSLIRTSQEDLVFMILMGRCWSSLHCTKGVFQARRQVGLCCAQDWKLSSGRFALTKSRRQLLSVSHYSHLVGSQNRCI